MGEILVYDRTLAPTEQQTLGDYLAGSMTSYQTQIDEAWGQLMARMVRHGRLPYCVRTPDALRECHLHLTLAITFQGFGLGVTPWEYALTQCEAITTYLRLALWPGVALSLAVFGANMLGDALRDVLDPRLRGTE